MARRGAVLDGDLRTRVKRLALRLDDAPEQAAALEPTHGSIVHPSCESEYLGALGCRSCLERDNSLLVAREYAVQHHDVKVHVQVQAAAEALNEGDSAAFDVALRKSRRFPAPAYPTPRPETSPQCST